jgi:hypothetical protein
MRELRPATPRHVASFQMFRTLATALLRNSIVVFILAHALHRLWTLMNSDILQLLRRVH